MRNAVGFYWTLPVPWVGFTTLPEGIDAAAQVSRTICHQRDVIRRHAKKNRFELVAEKVFLEIAPDRGSLFVLGALRPLAAICRAQDAVLIHVDFAEVQGWRSHGPLSDRAQEARIKVETLYPDPVWVDGQQFDPQDHFSTWRDQQVEWTTGKEARVARALEVARGLRASGLTDKAIADDMNREGVRSATGKPWTADNVRSLLGPSQG